MIAKFERESYLNDGNDFILRAFINVEYLTSPPHNSYADVIMRVLTPCYYLFREGPEACEAWSLEAWAIR